MIISKGTTVEIINVGEGTVLEDTDMEYRGDGPKPTALIYCKRLNTIRKYYSTAFKLVN